MSILDNIDLEALTPSQIAHLLPGILEEIRRIDLSGDALGSDLDNVRTLYVDPEEGSDFNTGKTQADQLKTIQQAINLLCGSLPQQWDTDDHRRIIVKDGATTIKESIIKPAHTGNAALIIQGPETLVHTGLTATTFSAIAGFEVRHQLALTAAGLTPNTLQDDAFIVLQDKSAIGEFESTWEDFPIVDNGASTLDLTAADPGVLSAYWWGASQLVDVVRPARTWQAPDAAAAFRYESIETIKNEGGQLIIRGFKFATPTNAYLPTLVVDNGFGSGSVGDSTTLQRCHITGDWGELASGSGCVGFRGCLGTHSTSASAPVTIGKWNIYNFRAPQYLVQTRGVEAITCGGFDGQSFGLNNNSYCSSFYADCRDGGAHAGRSSFLRVGALTVEDANAAPALSAKENARVEVASGTRLLGTTGNLDVGCYVGEHATLEIDSNVGSATLSGTAGNVRVGASAPQAYGAGDATDATEFAIYLET